ncbi:MAG TPA: hypothetical protein VJ957_07435, partial [Longimicrobiales bacterium]|nr:hypothetical protein [Longimicrobiales bacterium]
MHWFATHTTRCLPPLQRRSRRLRPATAACLPALLAAAAVWAPPATGQAAHGAPPPDTAAHCPSRRISHVFVDPHSIFDTSDPDLNPRLSWAYRTANALHVRTRASVIRRELLFHVGDCYDPRMLSETERILRGYPFLSRVDVFGVPQPDSSMHVIVDTQDEWSTQLNVHVNFENGARFQGIDVQEVNVLGTGQQVQLFYREEDVRRIYGVAYHTPQLFRTRWDGTLALGRTRAGTLVQQSITYPFIGEIGHRAFRQSFLHEDRFFGYSRGRLDGERRHVLVPVRERAFSLAGVGRLGDVGHLTMFGGGFSFEDLAYPGGPGGVSQTLSGNYDRRTPADSAQRAEVAPLMTPRRSVRALLLLGQRNIFWVKRHGLDTFRGAEDVGQGVELQLGLGRALPFANSDDDAVATATLYGANTFGPFLLAARGRIDARRTLNGPGADGVHDVLGEAEAMAYLRPDSAARHTLFVRTAFTGGWHPVTPFQLTLGGDLGVRGLYTDELPGGLRAVLNVEDRIYLGWPWPDLMDSGITLFADVGRIWPGDAPFGVDSGWRAGLGAGLRFNFPAGGKTTYRIDVAAPTGRPLAF